MTHESTPKASTPRWVCITILGLALISPLLHLWIHYAPPEGHVPTGLHTVDTYAYHSAMLHFQDDYYSPYATVDSPVGDRDPSLYALPHHRMYGWIGILTRPIPIPSFISLGIVQGLGLAFMLLMVWRLLRYTVPQHASTAFSLYALGGGLGGVLYLCCLVLGLTDQPSFGPNFQRFFLYELSEGARYQPYLLAARLYYTVALGLGFAALLSLIQTLQYPTPWRMLLTLLLFAACTYANFRAGPMFWAVSIIFLLMTANSTLRVGVQLALATTLGTALGAGLALRLLRLNPELTESAFRILSGQAWLVPLLSTMGLLLFLLPWGGWTALATLPRWARALACGAVGYLVVYSTGYVLHMAYFGNWLQGGESTAAIAVSDWALLGILPGLVLGWRINPNTEATDYTGWYLLWGLAFGCACLTALGQGWFLQFMPQRFIIMMGLPLAVLGALGITRLKTHWPRTATSIYVAILACGVVSILVTWTGTYGPLGHDGLQRHYTWNRQAFMTEADAQLLDHLDQQEIVLAPSMDSPLFGDVVALRGHKTVYGNGTLDYSRNIMPEVRTAVRTFFTAGTSTEERKALLEHYQVSIVFCPDTAPVPPEVVEDLKELPYLNVLSAQGNGVLFRVNH